MQNNVQDGVQNPSGGSGAATAAATSTAGSVSRLKLEIQVPGRGTAECELVRHLAPLTSRAILQALPLQDRVHRYAGDVFVYIQTGLTIGAEKQRTQFRRGDMAYMTSSGSICVFVKDSQAGPPMNPLGVVTAGLEAVESSRPGDVMKVMKRKEG